MLYCLYENTHTCLLRGRVRRSGTAQVPPRRPAYFARGECLEETDCPIGLVERKLELQTQRLSFETSERQAPICSYEHKHHHDGPVMSAKECARAPVPQHRRFRWPRTRWCASRRCVRTARAVRSARAQEERGAAFGGPPHPVAKLAGFHPRGWRSPPERPRRDTARHRRMAVTLRGMEAEKSARDRTRTRRVPEGRAMCRTFSP